MLPFSIVRWDLKNVCSLIDFRFYYTISKKSSVRVFMQVYDRFVHCVLCIMGMCCIMCTWRVCVCMYITDRAAPWREKRLHGCAACPAGLPHCCMLHFVNIIVSVFVAMRVCVYIYKYKYSREYFFQNFVGDLKLLDQKTKRNAHSHSHCCCCCFSPPTKTVHLGHTHKSASFSTSRFGCV